MPDPNRICTIAGCDRPMVYVTKGLCKRCYNRTRLPEPRKTTPSTPDIVRFEKNITPGPDGCWNWTGSRAGSRGGFFYGRINLQGRTSVYAHRWSYEYHRGEIPDGLEIDHLCHNKLCVNPWHLEPVTGAVNRARIAKALSDVCKYGHPYTPENTYWRPGRYGRMCKTCRREADRKANSKRPKPPPKRSEFCKNGHPLSGDNLVEKSGIRVCRACRRAAGQAGSAKRRAAAA